jgi:hypothetical protein
LSPTLRRWSLRALVLAVTLFAASAALAQDPYGPGIAPGGMGGPSGPPQGGAPPPKKPDDGSPELHAASGGSDTVVAPGSEPSLPDKPLQLKKRVFDRIGSDFDHDTLELGRSDETTRNFYGPYYEEQSGKYSFKLAFPFWAERKQPSVTDDKVVDRASLYGGVYYNRRSAERSEDVLFPLFWNLVDERKKSRTTVVGPLVNRVAEDGHDNWLAPLYFTGKRKNGGYTIIPPLLTYTQSTGHGGFNLIGPMFCSWEGGQSCDTRTAQDIDLGIAPFYFFGQNAEKKYEVIPPLLHYYRYDDRDLSWTNVWGPYYREHTQEREMFHLLPVYFSIWGKNERHTTLLPFFHYGWKDKSWLFANPLWLSARGQNGESTFVTWGYARYRGRTELDMITPLYWHYRDPDIQLDQKLLFPFLYSRTSPRESTQVFFPFWANSERFGVSKTTFITPFFQHSSDLRGWQTNIHPFVYVGRNATSTHTVVAPFFWDFADPKSRTTVVFPGYWRFAKEREVSQLVGNVYYHETKLSTGLDWEVHLFPFFSYGETPDGHWWNVLYGLAGYTRRGELSKLRTLWIPVTLSGKDDD